MGFAVFIHFHEVELSENDRKSLAQKMYEFAPIRECISHGPYIVTYRDMNRETFLARSTEVQQMLEQLLAQVQASDHDAFAAHLYRSRREFRCACE